MAPILYYSGYVMGQLGSVTAAKNYSGTWLRHGAWVYKNKD